MTLRDVLLALASDARPMAWDAWWVFALAAEEQPDVWAEAWSAMDESVQQRVLDRIAQEAGPIADFLVTLLSERLRPDTLGQARRMLREDSAEAAIRQIDRLRLLRSALAANDPQGASAADLAIEIQQLRDRQSRLEVSLETDPDYLTRIALEKEVTRLEALQASLRAYDRRGREALRQSLNDETAALSTERRRIEQEIRSARETKAAIDGTLPGRRAELKEATELLADAKAEALRLATATDPAREVAREVSAVASTAHTAMVDAAHRLSVLGKQMEALASQLEAEPNTSPSGTYGQPNALANAAGTETTGTNTHVIRPLVAEDPSKASRWPFGRRRGGR